MKRIKKIVAILLSAMCAGALAFALPACSDDQPDEGGTHTHVDANNDGKCDECNADMGNQGDNPGTNPGEDPDNPGGDEPSQPCTEHVDADGDKICDNCGRGLQSDKQNEFIFEAEYCDVQGINSPGWSGNISGYGAIQSLVANASNGYYVSGLYSEGNTLTFEITSDEATKADLVVRVSSIIPDMWLNSEQVWAVKVNGEVIDYGDVYLTGTGGLNVPAPFEDAIFIEDIDLEEGDNTIELVTVNDDKPDVVGTNFDGTAPEVDCIKVYTDEAQLTWEPLLDNLDFI